MKIIWGKKYYGNNNEGFYYEVKNDKIEKYCCDKIKPVLCQELGGRALTLDEKAKELVIDSYDFDTLRPIKFCMFCGEKIELEIEN
jgi:hypothetical protein